jgi:hypothetical protein
MMRDMSLSPPAFAELSVSNPMEAIRVLARAWLGVEAQAFAGHGIDHGVPACLRWMHRQRLAIDNQNQWVPESELGEEEGRLVFYVENQGVCSWATASSKPNGPVWVASSGEDVWREELPALDGFLLQALIFETIVGAPWGGLVSWCSPKDAATVSGSMTRLPLTRSAWLGELFAGEDVLMTKVPNGDGHTLWIGALTQEAEDRIRELADLDW